MPTRNEVNKVAKEKILRDRRTSDIQDKMLPQESGLHIPEFGEGAFPHDVDGGLGRLGVIGTVAAAQGPDIEGGMSAVLITFSEWIGTNAEGGLSLKAEVERE
jgi:hypothetical protein